MSFVCDECLWAKYTNDPRFVLRWSRGLCEDCGQLKRCSDIPSCDLQLRTPARETARVSSARDSKGRVALTPEQKAVAFALRGKTIARVILHPFDRGDAQGVRAPATHPTLIFTDGSRMRFDTQETESGVYGTRLVYPAKAAGTPKPIVLSQQQRDEADARDDEGRLAAEMEEGDPR